MHFFTYKHNQLYGEGVAIKKIANEVGTPFYLYSLKTLQRHVREFEFPFKNFPHITCYSVKACSNLHILECLKTWGSGFDIVSGGELHRVKAINADPKKIVFSGVGKTREELEAAIDFGILLINVESGAELKTIEEIATRRKKKVSLSLRINPDVDAKTHKHITTGKRGNKFGIEMNEACALYKKYRKHPYLSLEGLACHIGSQLTTLNPLVAAIKKTKMFMNELYKNGMTIRYLDIGGGLGITYNKENPPHPRVYGKKVCELLEGYKITLILEPGRVLIGNAGILITKVLYIKKSGDKTFIIVDAGMNDLIRPSLYGSYQEIIPLNKRNTSKIRADIVGPICETTDTFAKDRLIEEPHEGDLFAIMSAGAYGFSMSSQYNSRPRGTEILVNGKNYSVIRKRETYEDLIAQEM